MDIELDRLQFKGTRDFYNDMVGILDKYKITKSYCELCMLLAHKNQEASYARLILNELESSKPDFDRLCIDVMEIQRHIKSGREGRSYNREANLFSVVGNGF